MPCHHCCAKYSDINGVLREVNISVSEKGLYLVQSVSFLIMNVAVAYEF